MYKLHYYLERRKSGNEPGGERPLILSLSFKARRIKIYTGIKVNEASWDRLTERMLPVFADSPETNQKLDELQRRVSLYLNEQFERNSLPDTSVLQTEIKKMLKTEVYSFFGLMLDFIETNHSHWKPATFKKMKSFYGQLKKYSVSKEGIMMPSSVNQDFADGLIEFYRRRNLQNSSIKKNIDLLKWFMNSCLKKGLIYNRDFQSINFSPSLPSSAPVDIFLKWDELLALYKHGGLSKKEVWARDIFCFIVFSGIRFSSIASLKKDYLNGNNLKLGKDNNHAVSLNKFALEICNKYENKYYKNNSIFPPLSLISFHKYLRMASKKAGHNRVLRLGDGESKAISLCDVISAKVAINTHYSMSVRLGIRPENYPLNGASAKQRILQLPGQIKQAEENQFQLSEKLYESI